MSEFRVEARSGVPPYLQLVQQVEQAVRLGRLGPGDRLPTVKEIAAELAVNPNTVLKAYRELEHRGLTVGRVGQGTFIAEQARSMPVVHQAALRRGLHDWLESAFAAGLSEADVSALVVEGMREVRGEGIA